MAPKGGAQRKREREKMGKRGKERMCEETESRETKMSGLYWEEQPKPTAGKFRVGGRVCEVETEECWENVEPRSALVCKTCTPAPDPVSETKP